MKEIVYNEAPAVSLNIPEAVLARFRETRAALATRSIIPWGEHCSECAFPSCYSSCEFYTPRPDMHCRRFMNGIEQVKLADKKLSGLTRIAFRQWGKLEGSGPTAMLPVHEASHAERQSVRWDSTLAHLQLPRRIGAGLAYRLNLKRKARSARNSATAANAFIVEGWLEHPTPITMTLTMLPWDKSIDGLFQTQFTFHQGYNRHIVATSAIAQSMALDHPFAIQIEVVGDIPEQPIIFGMLDFISSNGELKSLYDNNSPAAKPGKSKIAKCVVWDLDDTVWTGTLVEDGIEGVRLNPDAAEAMRLLDARGILNSVASKNDEELALAALKHFGLDQYILFPQISWGPKSDAIRRIAESIDIGIDTFVFVDDQPFERGEVGASHPTVTLMTPDDIASFGTHALFNVPITEESKKRRSMYRDEEKRQRAATSVGTDYIGFLRSCNITLSVTPVTQESAERVYELTQRTNQLNVTGARFTREEVLTFVDGTHPHEGYVMRCSDNFGDYGIIGFCVLNREASCIEAFFMSCRVQRKRVEHAFFAWLAQSLVASGKNELFINYLKTAKNSAAVKMFADLGFTLDEPTPGTGTFHRDLSTPWMDADIVTVNAGA